MLPERSVEAWRGREWVLPWEVGDWVIEGESGDVVMRRGMRDVFWERDVSISCQASATMIAIRTSSILGVGYQDVQYQHPGHSSMICNVGISLRLVLPRLPKIQRLGATECPGLHFC